jgi:predicted O-methyltransferase YrrM
MFQRNVKIMVETGTARHGYPTCRSDGCSSIIFGHYAKITGAKLYSVDIDPLACVRAKAATKEFSDSIDIVTSDSLPYLRDFSQGLIDFLYLDSFDWTPHTTALTQEHHLKEINAAYDKLHARSIVMMDDCTLPGGGKCKLVDEFLTAKGWTRVFNSYQIIYLLDTKER